MTLRSTAISLFAAAVLVLGWNAVSARADGEGEAAQRLAALESQTKLLRAENDYLLARETALTKYIVRMNETATALSTGIAHARTQGFEAAAISAQSRVALLAALDRLSRDLGGEVPAPSKADATLKQEMAAARNALVK